jgi:hypothetical protein
MVALLVVNFAGYVYLGVRSRGQSEQLDGAEARIIQKVSEERERRLTEVQESIVTEQKRQDAHSEKVATEADARSTIAEKKADIAKTKAAAVERRTATIERKQRHVEKVLAPVFPAIVEKESKGEVPILVPTPNFSEEPRRDGGGLLDLLFGH